jgi:phosphatidylserine decarboxylase
MTELLDFTSKSDVVIQIAIAIVTAVLILIPLSLKWEIKRRVAFLSAVVFGICSGFICYEIDRVFPLSTIQLFVMRGSTIVTMAFIGGTMMFYRDPERYPSETNSLSPNVKHTILSPADGIVLYVKQVKRGQVPLSTKNGRTFRIGELTGTDLLDNGAYLIGIGMNLLNVHVNRAPIEGVVRFAGAVEGQYMSLKIEEAILRNERRTTVIKGDGCQVGVIQIASRLVRRIESYVTEGQTVTQGERIGIIHFGSQVDLVLPRVAISNLTKVLVKPGDLVRAGESIIALHTKEIKGSQNREIRKAA